MAAQKALGRACAWKPVLHAPLGGWIDIGAPDRVQGSGVEDYVGLFANASFGLEAIVERHKAAGDDYSYIMAEARRCSDAWEQAAAPAIQLESPTDAHPVLPRAASVTRQ